MVEAFTHFPSLKCQRIRPSRLFSAISVGNLAETRQTKGHKNEQSKFSD
jgi:hypothetical protein